MVILWLSQFMIKIKFGDSHTLLRHGKRPILIRKQYHKRKLRQWGATSFARPSHLKYIKSGA